MDTRPHPRLALLGRRTALLVWLGLASLRFPLDAHAATATATPAGANEASAIVQQIAAAQERLGNLRETIRLTTVKHGLAIRSLEMDVRLKLAGGRLKMYGMLTAPADVAGLQIVLLENSGPVSEGFIMLPGRQTANRITGESSTRSILGPDLRFEDLSVSLLLKANHKLIEKQADIIKLEATAKEPGSLPYGRILLEVSAKDFLPRRISCFDASGKILIKVVEIKQVVPVGDAALPTLIQVSSPLTDTRTTMEIKQYKIRVPDSDIKDDLFTPAGLESRSPH